MRPYMAGCIQKSCTCGRTGKPSSHQRMAGWISSASGRVPNRRSASSNALMVSGVVIDW